MSSGYLFGKIRPATDGKHKLEIDVMDRRTGRTATVKFGAVGYDDFLAHGDERRRANYLARSGGIRDGVGRLTKDDPLSPNFYARRVLWLSGEPW